MRVNGVWASGLLRAGRAPAFVLLGVCLAAVGGWVWLVRMAGAMPAASPRGVMAMGGAGLMGGGLGYLAWLVLMWAIMMAAMMLPTALPMALMFLRVSGDRARTGTVGAARRFGAFVLGYLVVWCGFSAAAALLHWGLEQTTAFSAMGMRLTSPLLIGSVLLAAGAWQLTPFKDACLSRCRTPLGFLLTEWRDGTAGATVMGLRHGLFCVGCCWALMALLFAAGVMNLAAIVLLTLFTLAEKTLGFGKPVSCAAGVALMAGGGGLVVFG